MTPSGLVDGNDDSSSTDLDHLPDIEIDSPLESAPLEQPLEPTQQVLSVSDGLDVATDEEIEFITFFTNASDAHEELLATSEGIAVESTATTLDSEASLAADGAIASPLLGESSERPPEAIAPDCSSVEQAIESVPTASTVEDAIAPEAPPTLAPFTENPQAMPQVEVESITGSEIQTAVEDAGLPGVESVSPLNSHLSGATLDESFISGVFTVDETGQVSFDFVYDGGAFEGELALFSLEGMEQFEPGSPAFIEEAARRALSQSALGHLVIVDAHEGARFDGGQFEANFNQGDYQGFKAFALRPNDRFALMLVPNGSVAEVLENSSIADAKRPLFSLVTANPNSAFHLGQIADVTGNGRIFVMEDLRVDHPNSDRDYNDLIFQVRGATGEAVALEAIIDPHHDWRNTDQAQAILNTVTQPSAEPQTVPDCVEASELPQELGGQDQGNSSEEAEPQPNVQPELPQQPAPVLPVPLLLELPQAQQPLVGIIDTGFAQNHPDIDYSKVLLGRDYVDDDANPLLQPGTGDPHGTQILETIAAQQNNGIGIDGINDDAPLWVSRAVPSGEWAEALVAFIDAARNSEQPNAVVNLSFDLTQVNSEGVVVTRTQLSAVERNALEYARQNSVLVVAASGSTGEQMSALGRAARGFDNILTVGAAEGLARAEYSGLGEGLGLVAPGQIAGSAGTDPWVGTSVATAQVTGIASLVWATKPELSYRQVIEILKNSATDLATPGWDVETGAGLVNLQAALQLAQQTPPVTRETLSPPTAELDPSAEGLERPASTTTFEALLQQMLQQAVQIDPTLAVISPSAVAQLGSAYLALNPIRVSTLPNFFLNTVRVAQTQTGQQQAEMLAWAAQEFVRFFEMAAPNLTKPDVLQRTISALQALKTATAQNPSLTERAKEPEGLQRLANRAADPLPGDTFNLALFEEVLEEPAPTYECPPPEQPDPLEDYFEAFALGLDALLRGVPLVVPVCPDESDTPLGRLYERAFNDVRRYFGGGGGWAGGSWALPVLEGLPGSSPPPPLPTLPPDLPDTAPLDPRYLVRLGATLGSLRMALPGSRQDQVQSLSRTFFSVGVAVELGGFFNDMKSFGQLTTSPRTELFAGVYGDVQTATVLGHLRSEVNQLKDLIQNPTQVNRSVQQLHFEATAAIATLWAQKLAAPVNPTIATAMQSTQFQAAMRNLATAYADINPNFTPQQPPDSFLNTLWGVERPSQIFSPRWAQSNTDAASLLVKFVEGVRNPTHLIQLSTHLLKAVQEVATNDAGVREQMKDPQFLWSLLELGKAYLALNPISVRPALLNFFLNTLRPPATGSLSPDAYLSALNDRLQAGTTQLQQFLEAAPSAEERLEMLNLATNLLKATKIAAASETDLSLREHAREPEFLKEVVDLAKNYAPLNPVGTVPEDFFLETLLNAEGNADVREGAAQLGRFMQGHPGAATVDPTQLMEFTNNLITVADRASENLGQTQEKAFFAELTDVGRTYLGLRPQVSSDEGAPLNFYLDTLLKDQQQRADLKEQGASAQTLDQQEQDAIAQAARELTPFLRSLNPSYDLSTPERRTKLIAFGQNLLEMTGRVSSLQPQKDNPQFLVQLIEFGTLYDALREELPDDSPHSFLYSLWQESQIPSAALTEAGDFFQELGTAIALEETPLFALRLLTANEHRVTLPHPSGQSIPATPDLSVQLAQLARAYAALEPEQDAVGVGSFLNTTWIARTPVNQLGAFNSLDLMERAATELQTFLVGDEILKGFAPANQPKVLEFTTKLLKAADLTSKLGERQKSDPHLLEKNFIDLARNSAHLFLDGNQESNVGQTFLTTLWNASTTDTAAIQQGVIGLEQYLDDLGLPIESMSTLSKFFLAIQLLPEELGENFQEFVQSLLENLPAIMAVLGFIVLLLLIPGVNLAVAASSAQIGAILLLIDAILSGVTIVESIQSLVDFFIELHQAEDEAGIERAADSLADALSAGAAGVLGVGAFLRSLPEFIAGAKLIFRDLGRFFRAIPDLLVSATTSVVRAAKNSFNFLSRIGSSGFSKFLKYLDRPGHLLDIINYLEGKDNVLKILSSNPKFLDDILKGNTPDALQRIDFLEELVHRYARNIDDITRILSKASNHFATIDDVVFVLKAAIDSRVDIVSLERLINLGIKNKGNGKWDVSNAFVTFISKISYAIRNPNSPLRTWRSAIDALETFSIVYKGPAAAPTLSPSTNLHGYAGIQFQHFLRRHTYEYFDFSGIFETPPIRPQNTLWPPGSDIEALLDEALTWLDNQVSPIVLVPFQTPRQTVPLSNGIVATIGLNSTNQIGLFHPVPDASVGVFNFSREEMEGFRELILP